MEVEIRTLTPLWTGGVDAGKVDRVHETGILGSLRWWYEAMVRALGNHACDPTAHKCLYDPEKPGDGICDVCRLFGATGWRRRFRLSIVDQTGPDTTSPTTISAKRPANPKTGRSPTWWFADHPRSGTLRIKIQSLAPDEPDQVVGGLLQFIADWSALGAKAQMGFGVIDIKGERHDARQLYSKLADTSGSYTYPQLPSLSNMFLARVSLPGAGEKETFNLKHDLRRLFADDWELRHFVMGTVSGTRMAAKVKMSRPYGDGLMRVWGWIPEQAAVYRGSWDRARVVDGIHRHLDRNYTLEVWREMNSPRDSVDSENSDPVAFLQSLLKLD